MASSTDVLMEPRTLRLDSLDTWRGLVILIMMLDHVRDFFNRGALTATPTEAGHTTVLLYATRWITHLCAPTFVFLAGVGIRFQYEKTGPTKELVRFLATRGIWLVFLDFCFVSTALNLGRVFFFVQVLYAIGVSMTLMAAIVRIRPRPALMMGIGIVLLSPMAVQSLVHAKGTLALLRTFALLPGPLPGGTGFVLYPFVPWLGIMCLGFGYGHVFRQFRGTRNRTVAWTGLIALLLFGLLRAFNGYGDLNPWKTWPTLTENVESFLNVSKYPPSPDYVLLTLGISLLIFLAIDGTPAAVSRPLTTFGRTPLFTYLLHFVILHCLQIAVGLSLGFPLHLFQNYIAAAVAAMSGGSSEVTRSGWGFSLWETYLIWLALAAMVYPFSRWFEGVKQEKRNWWVRYL